MGVSLYTSRVILAALGVDDFGIYNVVGGIVGMFSVISGSISAAISRFITFELGKNNLSRLKVIFSSAVIIQLFFSLLIIILAESIGLWFLNCKMNIAADKLYAANWVFQCSIISFVLNLINVPYNASIIAHEKMSAFAYISVIEVCLKLVIVSVLLYVQSDRLIVYSVSLLIVMLVIRVIYIVYCRRHFQECGLEFRLDRSVLKALFSFSGWNFIGASSAVLRDQGVNIIINIFFGVAVNAARGIAMQVWSAVTQFVQSFMMALNPQITKSYAAGDTDYMFFIAKKGAKFSFYILLLVTVPIYLRTDYVLNLWLGVVPPYTVVFTKLILIFILTESVSSPLVTIMLATGRIRNYQLVVGGLQMANFPVSYILFKSGFPPQAAFLTSIFISVGCLLARLVMLRSMVGLNVRDYTSHVIINVIVVAVIAFVPSYGISACLPDDFVGFALTSVCSMISTSVVIYVAGCDRGEKRYITEKIFSVLKAGK